jgi:plastocyanin
MHRAVLAALFLTTLLPGCTSGVSRPVARVDAVPDTHGVQHVDLDFHSYYFQPNRIVVHRGEPVELVVHDRSLLVPHNFTITDSTLNVSVTKWGPGSGSVRFTPSVPGEYEFFCHEHGHAQKGMTGTLVVLP